jgi:hypothetical protein
VQELLHKEPASLRERITKQSLLLLERMGFLGIMLFASVRAQTHTAFAQSVT